MKVQPKCGDEVVYVDPNGIQRCGFIIDAIYTPDGILCWLVKWPTGRFTYFSQYTSLDVLYKVQ